MSLSLHTQSCQRADWVTSSRKISNCRSRLIWEHRVHKQEATWNAHQAIKIHPAQTNISDTNWTMKDIWKTFFIKIGNVINHFLNKFGNENYNDYNGVKITTFYLKRRQSKYQKLLFWSLDQNYTFIWIK